MAAKSQRIEIPLPASEGIATSKFVASQRLANMFIENDPNAGKSALYGAPGLRSFCTLPTQPVRGVKKFGTILIAVAGQVVYTVTSAGAYTARGAISGSQPVDIAHNGLQAVIVSDLLSYVLDSAYTLTQITDGDFLGASSVDFLDQYLIFTVPNSGEFFISALADATSYDALDVATAERRPDNNRKVLVLGDQVLLMGEDSIDGYYDSGDTDFPFQPTSLNVDYGLAGRDAYAKLDNTVIFLASDGTVRALRGGTPQVVSTPQIAAALKGWTDRTIVRGFSYRWHGHEFLALRHPYGCLVYDVSSSPQSWSDRFSVDMRTWRIACAERIWDKDIAGDAESGDLYEITGDVYDENSQPLIREFDTNALGPGGVPFTLTSLEIEIEPGVGLITGQGSDPRVWVQVSRDGGKTFGSRLERLIGAIGKDKLRVIWKNFGQFRPKGCVIRFGMSDPVSLAITLAYAEIVPDNP